MKTFFFFALAILTLGIQEKPVKAAPQRVEVQQHRSGICLEQADLRQHEAEEQLVQASLPLFFGFVLREHCMKCARNEVCKLCVFGAKRKWCDAQGFAHVECIG